MNNYKPVNYRPSDLDSPFGIFQAFVSQYLGGRLAVMQPVEIVAVQGQFATVRPLLAHFDTLGQPIPITDDANIPNVPVVQPFGANGQFTFKPEPGDKGLLIACNWDTSKYKQAHGQTTVGSNRQFSWSDGFFLPVDFSAPPTGALIKNGGSSIAIEKNAINIDTPTLNINADTSHNGSFNNSGDMTIDGNLVVTGTIIATGTITGAGVTLSTHTHGVPPSTPAPTPGT